VIQNIYPRVLQQRLIAGFRRLLGARK